MCTKEYQLGIVKRLLGRTKFVYMNGNVQKVKRYELDTSTGQLTLYMEDRNRILLKENNILDVDFDSLIGAIEIMFKKKHLV
ncbi:MAG: hypothetical protein ACRC1P_09815 [Cellulosilyticaceae bacterium]